MDYFHHVYNVSHNITNATAAAAVDDCFLCFDNAGLTILASLFWLIILLFCFIGLAIVADDYLAPALDVIADHAGVPVNVAAASFLAFGSAVPEIMTSIVSVAAGKVDVSLPAIFGSGCIAYSLIPAVCVLMIQPWAMSDEDRLKAKPGSDVARYYRGIEDDEETARLGRERSGSVVRNRSGSVNRTRSISMERGRAGSVDHRSRARSASATRTRAGSRARSASTSDGTSAGDPKAPRQPLALRLALAPLIRDCIVYLLSLGLTLLFILDNEVGLYESAILLTVYVVYIIILYMGKSIWDDEEELSDDDERSLVSHFTEEERHMILSGELEVKDILHSRVGGRRGSQVGGGGSRRGSISGRRRSQQFNRRHSQSLRRLSTVVPPGLDSENRAPAGDVDDLSKAEPPADSAEPTTVMEVSVPQPGGEPVGEVASEQVEQEAAEAGPFDDLDVDAYQGLSEGPGTMTAADHGSGSGTGMATEDSPLLNKDLEAEFDDEDADDEEEAAGCCSTLMEYASCPFNIILEYTVPDLQVAEDERNAIEEERMVIEGTCLLAKQNRSSALLEILFEDQSPDAPAVSACLRRFKLNMLWLLREEPRKGCCDCSVDEIVEGAGKSKKALGTMQERAHHGVVFSNMIFNWRDATWKSAAKRKTESVEDLRASLALCVREFDAANAELEPREARVSRWELNQAILTFVLALGYTAVLSMATLAVVKGLSNTMGMPKSLAGVTLVAIGAEVPDTFASLAMAKLGEGPSAVSNCLNSQIINILIGLGLPYFIKSAISGLPMDMPKTGSTQVFIGVCLGTIVAMWMLVTVGVQACKRAKQPSLTPVSGYILISVYIIAVIAITLKTVL